MVLDISSNHAISDERTSLLMEFDLGLKLGLAEMSIIS